MKRFFGIRTCTPIVVGLSAIAMISLVAGVAIGIPPVSSHWSPMVKQGISVKVDNLQRFLASPLVNNAVGGNAYVGSEFCLACHDGRGAPDESSWRHTQHAATYIRPMVRWSLLEGSGVLANALGKNTDDFIQGLDFNNISSGFDKYKPNAPKLAVKNGIYTISIGKLDLPVIFVLQWRWSSGAWEQLFCVRVPVSDSPTGKTAAVYSSPLFYTTDGGWETYTPEAFYDDSNQPRFGPASTTSAVVANCESHDQNCVGCHATGVSSISRNAGGEYVFKGYIATLYQPDDPGYFDYDGDGNFEIMNVGCESCHGPGGNHILSGGNPAKIVNPGKIDAKGANDVCGQCHSVVASVPTGAIGWPYNENLNQGWIPGSAIPLESLFIDAGVWWPDGKTGMDTSQYPEFYKSTKPTYQYHQVRCIECHDAMSTTSNHAQVVESIVDGNLTIPTKVEDDTLCLGCHATHGEFVGITKDQVANYAKNRVSIGAVVETHTHHPYGPERTMGLSRCTTCHMATTQGPDGAQTMHGHTFEAISPQKTLKYQDQGGMPNSCALSCHGTKVNSFDLGLDPDPYAWNQQFDKDLANRLVTYYGPDGTWWKVDIDKQAGATGGSSQATASAVASLSVHAISPSGRVGVSQTCLFGLHRAPGMNSGSLSRPRQSTCRGR